MEYGHEQAVADGVNVDYDVYRIKTEITEGGSKVDAGYYVDKRDRATRAVRWEQLDEDLEYDANQLDRDVVTPDQIRTVVRTLPGQALHGNLSRPHRSAEDAHLRQGRQPRRRHRQDRSRRVRQRQRLRQKITYRTTGKKPEDLIAEFRNSYYPRIAVTVDMIATGTDIKPLEVVLFMRIVKSRSFFEQMKGRGVRVIKEDDLRVRHPGRQGQRPFRHRRCRRRLRAGQDRLPPDGSEEIDPVRQAAASRRPGQHRAGSHLIHRRAPRAHEQDVGGRRQGGDRKEIRRQEPRESYKRLGEQPRRRLPRRTSEERQQHGTSPPTSKFSKPPPS